MKRHLRIVVGGDIGEPVRRIEFEPMPQEAPAEPVRTPEPATMPKEPVPA